MTDRFSEYIRDVPMEIGRRFLPGPNINLPVVRLPNLCDTRLTYDFHVELRARTQYEEDIARQTREQTLSAELVSSVVTAQRDGDPLPNKSFPMEVLQPSKPDLQLTTVCANINAQSSAAAPAASFEDFEAASNVFDELELKTIDDRAALSQVLSRMTLHASSANSDSSSNSAPVPPQRSESVGVSSLSGNVSSSSSQDFRFNPSVEQPAHGSFLLNSSCSAPSTRWSTPVVTEGTEPSCDQPTSRHRNTPPLQPNQSSSLRARLLTKGYKENIVSVALERLPKERLSLIEYYMKSMRTLEKVGVAPIDALQFLIACNAEEKQKVLDLGVSASQLVQMGFSEEKAFNAMRLSKGDKVTALDLLLGATQ